MMLFSTKTLLTQLPNLLLFLGLCLLPSWLQASPTPDPQEDIFISIHFTSIPLPRALDEISKKSGLSITYNDADLNKNTRVTFGQDHVSVVDALRQVLKGTGLGYRDFKGIIVIYKLPPPPRAEAKGTVQGVLSDSQSGEPLIGASVRVLGTSLGGSTDVNGHYEIKDVTPGIYQLAVSYIGYETSVLRDVHVQAGQVTQIDHKLSTSKTELQSIEIIGNGVLSGNVVETNESAMVSSIRQSPIIITGISAQQINRSIDQDAGEVARRLPGVSVLNNFVNIRGMHERYNLTIINDMIAPSSETDRRAFSYDLLPSNMIDKMTVYRSPAPDLLADWAGGVIKVETKNTAIARQFEVNLSGWVRDQTTGKDYYTYDGGGSDWLGKDDGTRALPDGFPAIFQIPGTSPEQVNADGRSRKLALISADELAANAQWGKRLYSRWNLKRDRAPLDYRAGINYYDSWMLGKMRLNNLTSINTTQTTQIINQNFYPSRYYDQKGQLTDARSYEDTISRKSARWGLLQNLRLRINPNHSLELKGIFNQLGSDETYVRDGFNYINDLDLGYSTKVFYTYRSRSIFTAQLAGNHTLGKNHDHQLNWSGGYSVSKDELPGQRMMYLQGTNGEKAEKRSLLVGNQLGAFSIANSLYYSDSHEKNFTGFLDYEKKFGKDISVKVGAFDEKKTRDIDGRLINISTDPDQLPRYLTTADGERVDQFDAEKVFNPDNFREGGNGLFIFDNNYLSGQYRFTGNIVAGYVAVNLPIISKRLSAYGGVRYERQDLDIVTPYIYRQRTDSTVVDRTASYWLPSINLKYNIREDLMVRAAFGQTINRPNYREMVPIAVNDPRLELLQFGNSQLVDATVDNYDLRLEWYPSESELISVGVFYKRIEDAIEPYIETDGKNEQLLFSNTPLAKVRGVELEVRQGLNFLPVRWARYFSTIANIALLDSEVEFADSLFVTQPGNYLDSRPKNRQLEGTAKYVINAGLYFEHPEWGTKISLLYNVLGQRLVYAGTYNFPATYEMPRHVLDLTYRQKITKQLEFRAGVQDILNQPRKLYRDYDRDEKYNPDRWTKLPFKDYTFQKYKPGSYWMLGINLTF
jgi:TonB-dependent receptor